MAGERVHLLRMRSMGRGTHFWEKIRMSLGHATPDMPNRDLCDGTSGALGQTLGTQGGTGRGRCVGLGGHVDPKKRQAG